jgi:hypothetical protein
MLLSLMHKAHKVLAVLLVQQGLQVQLALQA